MTSEEEEEYPGNAKHHRSTDLGQLSSARRALNHSVPIRISRRAWGYGSTWREGCVWREEWRGRVTNGVIVRSARGLDLRGPPNCVIVILAYCQSVSRKLSSVVICGTGWQYSQVVNSFVYASTQSVGEHWFSCFCPEKRRVR